MAAESSESDTSGTYTFTDKMITGIARYGGRGGSNSCDVRKALDSKAGEIRSFIDATGLSPASIATLLRASGSDINRSLGILLDKQDNIIALLGTYPDVLKPSNIATMLSYVGGPDIGLGFDIIEGHIDKIIALQRNAIEKHKGKPGPGGIYRKIGNLSLRKLADGIDTMYDEMIRQKECKGEGRNWQSTTQRLPTGDIGKG